MKRILYIGSGAPWNGGAGYLLRQNLFLQALKEVADLHLAMFDAASTAPPFPCQFTSLVSPKRRSASKVAEVLNDLLSPVPRMMRGYDLQSARDAVASLHPEQFDAVFAYRIDFAHFAGVLVHRRLMLDIDDPEHIRWERRIRVTTGGNGDWRTRRDLLKLRRFEHRAVAKAAMAMVCQENDRAGWPKTPIVVPNCVDVLQNPSRQDDGPRILFVGNCAGSVNSPNVDGVCYFLRDIWPKILTKLPQARFQLIGTAGDAVRQATANSKQVELMGFVSDLASAYSKAAISITPIRFGTGTRLKILEAFAHACPVISTTVGAEGINAKPGQEIMIADGAQEFADQCIALLNDAQMRQRIGQGGHELVSRLYDRRQQHQRLVKIFGDFLR